MYNFVNFNFPPKKKKIYNSTKYLLNKNVSIINVMNDQSANMKQMVHSAIQIQQKKCSKLWFEKIWKI